MGVTMVVAGEAHATLSRNAAGAGNMGEAGGLAIDTALKFTTDPDGHAWRFEAALQYQLSARFQALLETAAFELQQPSGGDDVSGFGDTDVTLSWLALVQSGALPSVVLGGKVKLPTASHAEIGSGKPDFSGLLILGYELGDFGASAETEYVTYGETRDVRLDNEFLYTVTLEYGLSDWAAVYAEAFGNTAPTAPELRSDVALVGIELGPSLGEHATPYLSLEYDTEEALSVRGGIAWGW